MENINVCLSWEQLEMKLIWIFALCEIMLYKIIAVRAGSNNRKKTETLFKRMANQLFYDVLLDEAYLKCREIDEKIVL